MQDTRPKPVGAETWRQQEEEVEQEVSRRAFLAGNLIGVAMTGSVFLHWLRQPGNRELWDRRVRRASTRWSRLFRSLGL